MGDEPDDVLGSASGCGVVVLVEEVRCKRG